MSKPLSGRIALVTGASHGIGAAVALALAEQGAHIIAVARTAGALEELDDRIVAAGSTTTLVPLDVKDTDGILRLALAIHERYGKLDVLVGNAGVAGPSSPLGHIEVKAWSDVINLNLTANFQLIRCMEPLLRASDAGRAVFLTSRTGGRAPAYRGPYAASKAALETLVHVWAKEVINTTPVRVNLFDPGPTRTKLRGTIMPGEDPETLPTPDDIAEKLLPLCLPSWSENGKLLDRVSGTLKDPTAD